MGSPFLRRPPPPRCSARWRGGAALYAPPDRPDLWTERIEALLDDGDLARSLGTRGPERARRFTWERSANEHVEVFRETAGGR